MSRPPAESAAPIVLINGHRVPADAMHISSRDRGFTLADGLFETMRVCGGVVFRMDRHLGRLRDGLRVMAIPEPAAGFETWIQEAVSAAAVDEDLAIRLTVTRGPGAAGLTPPPDPTPTVVIAVNPMPQFNPTIYTAGLSAIVASGRRNSRAMTAGLKTVAYSDAVVASLEAQRAGADEAIFLDEDDHCSEATASNVFIVRDGVLITPPLSCAALPGITRSAVLELAAGMNVQAEERAIRREELVEANEVFLTSSLRGLSPVTRLDGRPIGPGRVGRVTSALRDAYAALVDRECSAT
jgi:branched-chain amino acid aminotransferase